MPSSYVIQFEYITHAAEKDAIFTAKYIHNCQPNDAVSLLIPLNVNNEYYTHKRSTSEYQAKY